MMIGRLVIACFAIELFLFDVSDGARPQCDTTLTKCSNDKIEKLLEDAHHWIRDFNWVYDALNCWQCRIDTTDLKKMLMRIIQREFPKPRESRDEIYRSALRAMASKEGWNDEMEKYMRKLMEYNRIHNIEAYYYNAWALVEYSRNWFLYAMDVHSVLDTTRTSYSARTAVYREIINRFKTDRNPAEKDKAESILYAVLLKEPLTILEEIDSYLIINAKNYENSHQRKGIFEKLEKYYIEKSKQDAFGYPAMFGQINKVKAHFLKLSTFTDYKPPLTIE